MDLGEIVIIAQCSSELTSCSSADDIAREAYDDAVTYFEQELTHDSNKHAWIRAQTNVQDVLDTVQKARALYTLNNATKARRHVVALSSRIHYYGGVFDALAQHHPEYVALAWGAIKFVVHGVLNHAELVVEISKALINIADVLPHIKLGLDLYPTIYMKEAVSRVYAHIMLFLKKAAKWYSMGPARRALSVLTKPYSIGYRDTVHQVRLCTESVNLVASAAARAELRDQTITLQEQMVKLQERDKDLQEMKAKLGRICDFADAGEGQFMQIIQSAQSKAPDPLIRHCIKSVSNPHYHQCHVGPGQRPRCASSRYPVLNHHADTQARPMPGRRTLRLQNHCPKAPVVEITHTGVDEIHAVFQSMGQCLCLFAAHHRGWTTS